MRIRRIYGRSCHFSLRMTYINIYSDLSRKNVIENREAIDPSYLAILRIPKQKQFLCKFLDPQRTNGNLSSKIFQQYYLHITEIEGGKIATQRNTELGTNLEVDSSISTS